MPMQPSDAARTVASHQAEGTLRRRLVAYLIDFLIILAFTGLLFVAILILGVVTFGLAWLLFPAIGPLAAILYNAVTVGGPAQATYGMRFAGVRALSTTGGHVDGITAAVHALLFYLAVGSFVLWLVDVIVALTRDDRRMGHDLLTGVAFMRTR